MDGSKERAHPAGAGTGNGQAIRVEEYGTKGGCTTEEREKVHNIFEHIVSRAGWEQPIVCRDERETRSGRAS